MIDPHAFANNEDPKGFKRQMYGGYFALVAILIQTYRSDNDRMENLINTMKENTKAIELRIDKVDDKLVNVDKKLVTFSNDIGWLQNEVKELRQGSKEIKDLVKRVSALEDKMNKPGKRSH